MSLTLTQSNCAKVTVEFTSGSWCLVPYEPLENAHMMWLLLRTVIIYLFIFLGGGG